MAIYKIIYSLLAVSAASDLVPSRDDECRQDIGLNRYEGDEGDVYTAGFSCLQVRRFCHANSDYGMIMKKKCCQTCRDMKTPEGRERQAELEAVFKAETIRQAKLERQQREQREQLQLEREQREAELRQAELEREQREQQQAVTEAKSKWRRPTEEEQAELDGNRRNLRRSSA